MGEVGCVGESVGDASEVAEFVVGAFDAAVAGPVRVVEGEDLVAPAEQGSDDRFVLGAHQDESGSSTGRPPTVSVRGTCRAHWRPRGQRRALFRLPHRSAIETRTLSTPAIAACGSSVRRRAVSSL